MPDYTKVIRKSNCIMKCTNTSYCIANYTDIVHELYIEIYKHYTKTTNYISNYINIYKFARII